MIPAPNTILNSKLEKKELDNKTSYLIASRFRRKDPVVEVQALKPAVTVVICTMSKKLNTFTRSLGRSDLRVMAPSQRRASKSAGINLL